MYIFTYIYSFVYQLGSSRQIRRVSSGSALCAAAGMVHTWKVATFKRELALLQKGLEVPVELR